jgi:hypothetical protein
MPRCAFLRTGAFLHCRERARADMESAPTALKKRLVGRGLDPSAGRRGRRPLHRFNACFGPVCRGRTCPARQSTPLPVHGSPVGEGFIPSGHLPPPRTGTGGSRPSPTNCPEMCAYQNAAGMPGPYRSAINKNPGTLIPCVPGKLFSAYFSCAANSCGAAL